MCTYPNNTKKKVFFTSGVNFCDAHLFKIWPQTKVGPVLALFSKNTPWKWSIIIVVKFRHTLKVSPKYCKIIFMEHRRWIVGQFWFVFMLGPCQCDLGKMLKSSPNEQWLLGYFEIIKIQIKTAVDKSLGIYWKKIGLLYILASGHIDAVKYRLILWTNTLR